MRRFGSPIKAVLFAVGVLVATTAAAEEKRNPPDLVKHDTAQFVGSQACVTCHAKHPGKAPRLDRAVVGRGRQRWYASYQSLAPKYGFWNYGHGYRTTPGKFGARASKLLAMLEKGHHDVKLPAEDLHRITLWLDSCSVFYGVYEKAGGEAQLRGEVARPTLE